MRWKTVITLFIAVFIVTGLFPHFGAPQFRYTGSDPGKHVWNLGWPLATAIYDKQSGLHIGPFAFVLVPIEAVLLVLMLIAAAIATRKGSRKARAALIER